MRSCSILLVSLLGCNASDSTVARVEQPIFGGQVVTDGPIARSTVMFVPQGGDGQHGCSASIIDGSHALTAAHCLFGLVVSDQPELLFAPIVTPQAPRRTVVNFVTFNAQLEEDIAVLTFNGGLPAPYEPVAIAAADLPLVAGDPLIHAGYGQTTATVNDRGTLHAVTSKFVETRPPHIYVAHSPNAALCSGDSGGPDYVENGAGVVQIGVHVSGDCDSYGSSTDVRSYISFIQSTGASPMLVSAVMPGVDGVPDAGVPPGVDEVPDAGSGGPGGSDHDDEAGGCNLSGGSRGWLACLGILYVARGMRRRKRLADA